jgi:hypothetical protein
MSWLGLSPSGVMLAGSCTVKIVEAEIIPSWLPAPGLFDLHRAPWPNAPDASGLIECENELVAGYQMNTPMKWACS